MADGGPLVGEKTRPLWQDTLFASATYLLAAVPVAVTGTLFPVDVLLSALIGAALVALSVIDMRRRVLPNMITLPLILIGLGASWLLGWGNLVERILATLVAYLMLFLAAGAYRRLRGRDGLGMGDAKLFAASGAWLGLAALPQVLLAACLLALASAGALLASGRKLSMQSVVPFGPLLAFATWLVWLYGSI